MIFGILSLKNAASALFRSHQSSSGTKPLTAFVKSATLRCAKGSMSVENAVFLFKAPSPKLRAVPRDRHRGEWSFAFTAGEDLSSISRSDSGQSVNNKNKTAASRGGRRWKVLRLQFRTSFSNPPLQRDQIQPNPGSCHRDYSVLRRFPECVRRNRRICWRSGDRSSDG